MTMSPKNKRTFPEKLWQIVNDSRFDSAIRWTQSGTSFEITEEELKRLCLGKRNKLFHTEQPKSFIRQLHLYGFRKVDRHQFKHECFQRSRPQLIGSIKRSYKNIATKPQQADDGSRTMDYENLNDSLDPPAPLQQLHYDNIEAYYPLEQQMTDYSAYCDYYTDLKPMEYIY